MIVIDSSTLIWLAKSELLDTFINNSKKKLVITREIENECTVKRTFDAQLIEKRIKEGKIKVFKTGNDKSSKIQEEFNIGPGESEAIALCIEKNFPLITDDKKAINACKILRISFTTAPNILLSLKDENVLDKEEVNTYWKKIKKYGRYSIDIIKKMEETK